MQVQALCVGRNDWQGVDFALIPMADFSTLPYVDNGQQRNRKPYINADVVSRSGPFEGETKLPEGVHLHWALPAGLTRGQQQTDGSLVYPVVPNRWLVTRLIQKNKSGTSATIQTQSWIVESDRLNLNAVAPGGIHQPTVPTDPNVIGQNFRYIGQAFSSSGWSENPTAERFTDLTAMGYGETTFASYYPNCSTVFGFFDNAVPGDFNDSYDSLSYQVSGWYSDGSKDPCAAGITSGDNAFGWVFSNENSSTVNNCVCSGLVENILWNSSTTYITPSSSPLTVSVGPSVQEALSALLANFSDDPEQAETVLNALQFGLLTDVGTISGSVQNFEERVHEAGFSNYNGGITWQVRRKAGAGADPSYEGEVTLPEPVAQDLNTLNLQQTQLDELKETLASKRSQLFSDWYKYLLVEYDTQLTPGFIRGEAQPIRDYITAQADIINELQQRVAETGTLQQNINSLAEFIRGMLDDAFELTNDTASGRYWQANNPVFVLQGDQIVPVNRTGEAQLTCRISDWLVNSTTLNANVVQGGQPQVTTSYIQEGHPVSFPPDAPAALLNCILNDAVLTAASLQPAIAATIWAFVSQHYNMQLNFSLTVSALQDSLHLFISNDAHPDTSYATDQNATALAPDPLSIFTWTRTPWLPIMLQYKTDFTAVQYVQPGDSYDVDFITNNFSWGTGDIELEYQKNTLSVDQQYEGTVLLSADSQVNLTESIRQFLLQSGDSDPELQSILDSVSDMPLLAQEFSGLQQAMLMRQQSLQMKVADPLANTFDQPFVASVAAAVGNESAYSPETDFSFNPIRTGTFSITGLRLIDAFGRFQDQTSSPAAVAKGIQPPTALGTLSAGTAFLPPRLAQPSRLRFNWLSADYDALESNSHPASSPVIGWVLPDYADNSLFIYNADGTPLGELAVSADTTTVLWFPAPGGLFPIGTDMQTVMENQLPWLRNFAMGIYNNGNPATLITMINSLRVTAAQTLPAGSSNNSAGILMGQPLAIARATLRLDLAGDAAASESWEAFAESAVGGADPDTAAFTSVKFPVKLGLQGDLNDGLFGYWIEEDTRIDFTRFYDSESSGSPLTLTAGYTPGSSKNVMMLVDPKGEVHATTGILPVKSIAIPSDQYGAALGSLSVTFLTAPVLSGSNTTELSVPLPKTDSGQWSWINVANGQWQSQNFSGTVQNSTQGALDYTPQQLIEGWLRLRDFEN